MGLRIGPAQGVYRKRAGWLLVLSIVGLGIIAMAVSLNAPFAPPHPTPTNRVDGDQAMRYLINLCRLGPRITASPAHATQRKWLRDHFEALGASVTEQSFPIQQPSQVNKPVLGTNVVVVWNPQAKRRILLGAHSDTRPIADREPRPRDRNQPILGANDGASGVALLMELGRVLPTLDLEIGVDFAFFDAEEYIFVPNQDQYFLGSIHFVEEYVRRKEDYRYVAVVIVDMIGDSDLTIYQEGHSLFKAGPLVQEIWGVARDLGVDSFIPQHGYDVEDDHRPFQKKNIPAITIIDFRYPHWHTLADTPDKCSGESLEAVGRVLVEWLRRKKAR